MLCYVLPIIADPTVNTGIKVLYLERAITEDCQTFLLSLDKLYDPAFEGSDKEHRLGFIQALKCINDLCFNNQIKFGEFGIKNALIHYFKGTGIIDKNAEQAAAFQAAVRKIIKEHIDTLQDHQQQEIATQKAARISHEQTILRQPAWREALDLPSAQLPIALLSIPRAIQQLYHHNLISEQMIHNLSNQQLNILCSVYESFLRHNLSVTAQHLKNLELTFALISEHHITFDQALTLTEQQLKVFTPQITQVIFHNRIHVNRALRLTAQQLSNFTPEITRLILMDHIDFDQALTLTEQQVKNFTPQMAKLIWWHRIITVDKALRLTEQQLSNFTPETIRLILNKYATFKQISILTAQKRHNLHNSYIIGLIEAQQLTIKDVIAFDPRIMQLIQESRLTVTQAKYFSKAQQMRVCNLQPLISMGYITLDQVFALTESQFYTLSNHYLIELIKEGRLPFEEVKNCHYPLTHKNRLQSNDKHIIVNNVLQLTSSEHNFSDDLIGTLGLPQGQYTQVNNAVVLINDEKIITQAVSKLSEPQFRNLRDTRIMQLIQEGQLTVEQAKQLSIQQILDMNNGKEAVVLQQLHKSRLSLVSFALSLVWQAITQIMYCLNLKHFITPMQKNHLTIEQIKASLPQSVADMDDRDNRIMQLLLRNQLTRVC